MALQAWKEKQIDHYDRMDGIILVLSDGDPEKRRKYRTEFTHTEIAEAYLSRLINGGT